MDEREEDYDHDRFISTTLPHSDFGDAECCGCLYAEMKGDVAEIKCNECCVVLRSVAVGDLQRTLDEMELSLDMDFAACPYCGAVNLFPGFSKILAFTCKECGEVVKLTDRPEIKPLFG